MAEIDRGTMVAAGKAMGDTDALIRMDLTKLRAILQRLQETWRSDASMQMDNTMERWNDAQGRLLQALANIQRLMGESEQKFRINEQEQTTLMQISADYTGKL